MQAYNHSMWEMGEKSCPCFVVKSLGEKAQSDICA